MTFEEWNGVLARRFFNPGQAGKRVYLHTTKELLVELSGSNGGVDDFITAIKIGPAQIRSGEMCTRAIAIAKNWRASGIQYPPYIAYLCLFALAAGHDGNWPRHAYYPRLWDLLKEPNSGAPPQFRVMSALLWRDLEVWSHSDKKGEFGLFKFQSALDWIYVGLPIAQTILTDEERSALPRLFERADLEPGAILPEGQLAALLVQAAERQLRRRTLQLLSSSENSDYKTSLLEILQAELGEWDGTVPESTVGEATEKRAGLRLWLKEIDPAGFITCRVVAFLPESLEPDGMLIESTALPGKAFECQPQAGRITDSLRESGSNEELKGELLRWDQRTEFRCSHTGTRLILPASPMRVFASGGSDVSGFVEAKKAPSQGDFFLAAHNSVAADIEKWGAQFCRSWNEVKVKSGLPTGWRLFQGSDASSDGGLASRFPALARSVVPRIGFEGGVRGNKAAYFPFALPKITVDWHQSPSSVKCNGKALQSNDGTRYTLQPEQTIAVNLIEVEIGGLHVQASLFVVSDGWKWGEGTDCPMVDQFGTGTTAREDQTGIRGAQVRAAGVPAFVADSETMVDENESALLLGRVPGQIADLRRGEALPQWPAVWAVNVSRRRVVFAYCGTAIEECEPISDRHEGNPKRWASIIWVSRKRTDPVKNQRIRELLSAYREVARAI